MAAIGALAGAQKAARCVQSHGSWMAPGGASSAGFGLRRAACGILERLAEQRIVATEIRSDTAPARPAFVLSPNVRVLQRTSEGESPHGPP